MKDYIQAIKVKVKNAAAIDNKITISRSEERKINAIIIARGLNALVMIKNIMLVLLELPLAHFSRITSEWE
jgi:hypothetical protein